MLTPPEEMDEKHFDTFDIITAMEVIEHVNNKEVFVRALGRLLKPCGIIFPSSIDKSIKSYLKLIVSAEYITSICLSVLMIGSCSYRLLIWVFFYASRI